MQLLLPPQEVKEIAEAQLVHHAEEPVAAVALLLQTEWGQLKWVTVAEQAWELEGGAHALPDVAARLAELVAVLPARLRWARLLTVEAQFFGVE